MEVHGQHLNSVLYSPCCAQKLNFFGGGFFALQKPVVEVFPVRGDTREMGSSRVGHNNGNRKDRGRRAKIDNEKQSEKVSCTSLHHSERSLIFHVFLPSCLFKFVS